MMQTIRSRFLTVICGVSLTLTLVFGSLCVFLVDRSRRKLPPRPSLAGPSTPVRH